MNLSDIYAELECVEAICFIIGQPLVSQENLVDDVTLGQAISGVSHMIARIKKDIEEIELSEIRKAE